jgi:hypothetical protein
VLKANLFVFTLGIIVGGSFQYLNVALMKDSIETISTSIESKLSSISLQLSESRHFNQHMMPVSNDSASQQTASTKGCPPDLKLSIQTAMEANIRPIMQEELEYFISQLSYSHSAAAQLNTTIDQQVEEEHIVEAEQLLSMAMGVGVWTQQNNNDYSEVLSNVSGEAQAEAYRQLSVAINDGDLVIDEDISFS